MRDLAVFIATGFGSGRLPVAPGTWGSVVGVAIGVLILSLTTSPLMLAIAGALLAVVGQATTVVYLETAERADPPEVVIDEIAGQYIPLAALAWFFPLIDAVVASFVLFRLFDILKPWPIRRIERVGGAAGVMLDDLAAGVAATMVGFIVLGAIYGFG